MMAIEALSPHTDTLLRTPQRPLVRLRARALELPPPLVPPGSARDGDNDLTLHGKSAPLGEKIIVSGRIVGEDGRAVRRSLVEIWQANALGRYRHPRDRHDAPLDPNFTGIGRTFTDDEGRYRFVTIKPGSYPWPQQPSLRRPRHIHFSLLGNAPIQRLVTQMYFPGDPLLESDPIHNAIADPSARRRTIASLSQEADIEGAAPGYRFDIVLAAAA